MFFIEIKKFSAVQTSPSHPFWEELIRRPSELYQRADEIRSPFSRDYTRIIHSNAYRRLKHKTQVFYNIENDHICTRMEHVAHVESVSGTIAKYLGLNDELTKAIAIGHDLGHAPFGHRGEVIIRKLSWQYLKKNFWHEQNGLHFVDDVELLEDNYNIHRNLNLTYAVRDGIISHCGEVDQNGLIPRRELFSLSDFQSPNQYQPATWEGCVVKIADKIAYIGRDIEDAIQLGFLEKDERDQLVEMARANDEKAINTTVIMHNLIIDICKNSDPDRGICLSSNFYQQMNAIRDFNIEHIYKHKRLKPFELYSELVLTQLFTALHQSYDEKNIWSSLEANKKYCPLLFGSFEKWLAKYCEPECIQAPLLLEAASKYQNTKIYGSLDDESQYIQAILDFISGMTDRFAVKAFQEMLQY